MEDGSCHQTKRDNVINIEEFDTKLSQKSSDHHSNLNGTSEKVNKALKTALPNHNKFDIVQKTSHNDQGVASKLNIKNKTSVTPCDFKSDGDVVPKLPKPLITQHSTFRRVLKRPFDDLGINSRENGDNKKYSLPYTLSGISHGSKLSLQKQKLIQKKRKLDGSQQNDYAQYLGLQPAVKFKCSKCCCSSFESLGMLKEHQRYCVTVEPAAVSPLPLALPPTLPPAAAAANTNFRITRKVYLCSACGTYYENWNLFLHIREVHNRHTCLFCFGMFSQAQKLASHLVVKHNIQENHFASKEDLYSKFSDSFFLLCCKCEKVFTERENFIVHECSQVIKQCSVCKVKGSHSPECPKNFKHKRALQSQDTKKGKKTSLAEKKPSLPLDSVNVIDSSAESTSPEKSLLESVPVHNADQSVVTQDHCQSDKSKHLEVITDLSSLSSHNSPVSKSSPLLEHTDTSPGAIVSEIINNNNKEENLELPFPNKDRMDDLNKEMDISKGELDLDEEGNQVDNRFHTSPAHNTSGSQEAFPFMPVTASEEQLSVPSFVKPNESISLSQGEPVKTALKLPPRNRRPPKRYQFKNLQKSVLAQDLPEEKQTVNRVPKLTVKVPKILTNKESTSDYSSESEDSDKLTVDFDMNSDNGNNNPVKDETELVEEIKECLTQEDDAMETEIVAAGEDVALTELTLDRPLDRYPLQDLLRVLLTCTVYNCIYCNHARKVAVNAKQLALHFISEHRFTATVDSITAEELMPETIVIKIRSCLQAVQNIYLNLEGYSTDEKTEMKLYDHRLECFQCFFVTTIHKDLYMHNRKMHQKTILLCMMCKSNFYSYSELLCHLCPGTYLLSNEIQFRCCLCPHDAIPSAFRLMVHLRKQHHACDVCLETCQNQSKLSNHVWKHKLHHLCYRCGIAYRNKPDITKHLFWKHGTESVLCKKCLQKRWPHVYHFCIPPNSFVCEECNLTFSKAVSLKVHKRLHSNDNPYACSEENCDEKFISKKLLLKHELKHLEVPVKAEEPKPIIIIDDNQDEVMSPAHASKEPSSVVNNVESKNLLSKNKKYKKNKKNKEKDNLLIDVNLPALNLSESDSSEESESESAKKVPLTSEEPVKSQLETGQEENPILVDEIDSCQDLDLAKKGNTLEEPKQEQPAVDIWDNFKIYQAEIEKQTEKIQVPKPRHVCDSDHDYCVIPIYDEDNREDSNFNISESAMREYKKKQKTRKKSKKTTNSSSSDSSSDSDSCSCASNCSCSSSSGSSSSSSSSSDSESSSNHRQRRTRKDSDASAVDIMATEESPPSLVLPEPQEVPIAETDLETEETETDEDFYDEHPQRLANKILAEKRNQLLLLATVAPVNNGTYLDSSRPPTPENLEKVKEVKKKVKTKKKKKSKKAETSKLLPSLILPVPKISVKPGEPQVSIPNKITISLQTKTVIDKSPVTLSPVPTSTTSRRDSDSKRASKRRRVPNKFYGYSSDEEYAHALKSHLPPKLEWRKEDLPSPSAFVPQPTIPDIIDEVVEREPKLMNISPKIVYKEQIYSSSDEDSDSSREGVLQINHPVAEVPVVGQFPFPRPAGVRAAREGESVYCYCRCPYDEVSEMIACDADGCLIEWFHFECVGIMVPPKGQWYCPDCRQRLENEES